MRIDNTVWKICENNFYKHGVGALLGKRENKWITYCQKKLVSPKRQPEYLVTKNVMEKCHWKVYIFQIYLMSLSSLTLFVVQQQNIDRYTLTLNVLFACHAGKKKPNYWTFQQNLKSSPFRLFLWSMLRFWLFIENRFVKLFHLSFDRKI